MKSTCKGCEKRTIGCHSTCEEYITARADYEKEQAEIKKQKDAINDSRGFYRYCAIKAMRKKGIKA